MELSTDTCDFAGCGRKPFAKKLCSGHYEQQRRGATLQPLRRRSADPSARDAQGRKMCAGCGSWVEESGFSFMKTAVDQRNPSCTRCKVVGRFGLNRVTYEALLNSQGGGCAICGGQPTDGRNFHVDHDHSCCPGQGRSCGRCIRGLLCNGCNVGIGMMGDNPERLIAAAQYLSR